MDSDGNTPLHLILPKFRPFRTPTTTLDNIWDKTTNSAWFAPIFPLAINIGTLAAYSRQTARNL